MKPASTFCSTVLTAVLFAALPLVGCAAQGGPDAAAPEAPAAAEASEPTATEAPAADEAAVTEVAENKSALSESAKPADTATPADKPATTVTPSAKPAPAKPAVSSKPAAATPAPTPAATPAPAAAPAKAGYSGPTPCLAQKFSVAQVRSACDQGGKSAAKAVMKQAVKKAEAAGVDLKCTSCHTDTSSYGLTGNAVADLRKWL